MFQYPKAVAQRPPSLPASAGPPKNAKESDRAKRAHGGVKNEKFAEIVLIYAGSERSELASDSDSAKLMQFIAAVSDAFLRSRPRFCPRKARACQPVAGVRGGLLCCFW